MLIDGGVGKASIVAMVANLINAVE